MNFDHNVRLMMSTIKGIIKRGNDTKNWSISKFHELLHMAVDMKNFGSLANIDAGKGEHGLKSWAKLPSKTVRKREANLYYMDMAQRIYENRILSLAASTLLPVVERDSKGTEVGLTISLSHHLLTLMEDGATELGEELAIFLRRQAANALPIDIYQEAKYSRDGVHVSTIRASPKYRNTGPWYDWVMVCYENDIGEKQYYPFQVHGFFEKDGIQQAVGKMGQRRKATGSCLLENWTLEASYRLVDMETISHAVFGITIPASCYHDHGGQPNGKDVLVFKDRMQEWPRAFGNHNWNHVSVIKSKSKKRKTKT
jgi:hypothetical protein